MANGNTGKRTTAAPVEVRQMSNPRDGWSLADAVRMARQGYTLRHIEERTGWAMSQVLANMKARDPGAAISNVHN